MIIYVSHTLLEPFNVIIVKLLNRHILFMNLKGENNIFQTLGENCNFLVS